MQCATACSAPSASSATFTWKDMTNYVGQRENFLDNCGPQNEAQNETHCASQKFHSIAFQNAGQETCD